MTTRKQRVFSPVVKPCEKRDLMSISIAPTVIQPPPVASVIVEDFFNQGSSLSGTPPDPNAISHPNGPTPIIVYPQMTDPMLPGVGKGAGGGGGLAW